MCHQSQLQPFRTVFSALFWVHKPCKKCKLSKPENKILELLS